MLQIIKMCVDVKGCKRITTCKMKIVVWLLTTFCLWRVSPATVGWNWRTQEISSTIFPLSPYFGNYVITSFCSSLPFPKDNQYYSIQKANRRHLLCTLRNICRAEFRNKGYIEDIHCLKNGFNWDKREIGILKEPFFHCVVSSGLFHKFQFRKVDFW